MEINLEELKRGGVVKLLGKDNYSVWVKVACNNISSRKLEKIADISDKYGKGFFLFTTNQIPIIPHINLKDVMEVKQKLKESEQELDACGPRIRGVKVCYSKNICPYAVTDALSLGEKLDKFFYLHEIKHKLKISVSGCPVGCTVPRILSDIGFAGIDEGRYDVYIGGRLGLKPYLGDKIAENLSEEEGVVLVENYLDMLRKYFKKEERSADIISDLGLAKVKEGLNYNLKRKPSVDFGKCETKINKDESEKIVLRIKALLGEITSKQARKIAEISKKFANGFVHLGVRGTPEITGVDKKDIEKIKEELKNVDLEILSEGVLQKEGVDNLITCFGNYCDHGIMNTQELLKKIDNLLKNIKIKENIKISASGCPNNCGISPLSDIGFTGIVEVEIIEEKCNGCKLCEMVCKVKAIEMKDNIAKLNKDKCKHCGECERVCPVSAISEKRKGYLVYLGGIDLGVDNTKLGTTAGEFLSEEEVIEVVKSKFA